MTRVSNKQGCIPNKRQLSVTAGGPGKSGKDERQRIAQEAKKMLGMNEREFGEGDQWCTEFVARAYKKAGVDRPGWNNPDDWRDVKKFGEKKDCIDKKPKVGDVALWKGHTAVVVGVDGNKVQTVTTIGGNENDKVRRKERTIDQMGNGKKEFVGFVDVVSVPKNSKG